MQSSRARTHRSSSAFAFFATLTLATAETERYYDRGAVDALLAKLRGELVPGRVYVPAQLKDVLGFSRKYLIPFLEFCDRIGVTERREQGRTLRQTSATPLDSFQAHP